jgi:hypothetical protein
MGKRDRGVSDSSNKVSFWRRKPMTTIPTTALIIGAIILFMLGGFVGVSLMALMNIAKEADKQVGADEGERRRK